MVPWPVRRVRESKGRIVPCPTRARRERRAPHRRRRQRARQARPGARHRPRAAPAAALRGRDAHRADRRRCTTATTGAGRRRRRRLRASSSGRAASSSCRIADDSGDLVLRFLHFYPSQQKTLARRHARARARRGARRLLRPRDGPSGVQGRDAGDAAADGADAGLPEHACSCRRPCCARRSRAGRARADLDEHLPAGHRPAPACRRLREALALPARAGARARRGRARGPLAIRPGSGSSSRSCSRSSCRSCSRSASAQRQRAPRCSPARAARCTSASSPRCRSR